MQRYQEIQKLTQSDRLYNTLLYIQREFQPQMSIPEIKDAALRFAAPTLHQRSDRTRANRLCYRWVPFDSDYICAVNKYLKSLETEKFKFRKNGWMHPTTR